MKMKSINFKFFFHFTFQNRWSLINTILKKIETYFNKHEKSTVDDLKTISELKIFSNERKNREIELKEKNDREWKKLSTKPDEVQMIFFYTKFGPLKGKKEYSDWKGNSLFSKVTKNVKKKQIFSISFFYTR